MLSGSIKNMVDKLYVPGKYYLNNSRTDVILGDELAARNVALVTDGVYDYRSFMSLIFKTYTGMSLYEYTDINELYKNYELILHKTTSYSTLSIAPSVTDGDIVTASTSVTVNIPDTGYIGEVNGTLDRVLEVNNSNITGVGNDYINHNEGIAGVTPTINSDKRVPLLAYHQLLDVNTDQVIATVPGITVDVLSGTYDVFAPDILSVHTPNNDTAYSVYGNTSGVSSVVNVSSKLNVNSKIINNGVVQYSSYAELLM
jgi:hypothetical protein